MACVVLIALQLVLLQFVHGSLRFAPFIQIVALPFINAIVLVNVAADAGAIPCESKARIERLVDRTWAIILLDVGQTLCSIVAISSMAGGDLIERLMGVLVFFMLTMLVYAEPYAAIQENVTPLALVPFALLRSMMLAWVNMPRICALFGLQLALAAVSYLLAGAFTRAHWPGVEAANVAYATITSAALSALFAVAYLDTASHESETPAL